MNSDKALEVIEQILSFRPLKSIERFVLRESWHGKTYSEMARVCNYGIVYIREVGAQLWQDLSKVLGKRVNKKNLHVVINDYQQNHIDEQRSELKQNLPTENRILDLGTPPEIELQRALFQSCHRRSLEFPGSSLPGNSPLYINRPPIEELIYSEISQPGSMIQIKAPRQMGKSSLLNRVIAYAKTQGHKTVYLDLQEVDRDVFASLDRFLRWLCINLSRQLNLNPQLDEYWNQEIGTKASCKLYFEEYLLEQVRQPILLALNEVNRVSQHPNIVQDFLPMLRYWHELAKQVEDWQKLRFVLVHSTDIDVSLGLNQSPFSVGLSIRLPPFTLEQVQDLAQRYGLNWAREEGIQQLVPLVEMVGGHPYLVNIALYHLQRGATTLEELLQFAPTPAGIYGDHLRDLLALLREDAKLTSALQQVVTTDDTVQLEAITAYKLESLGLVQLHGNKASPSCQLYHLYFREQLGEKYQFASHFLQPESEERDCQPLDTIGQTDTTNINQQDGLPQLVSWHSFNTYLKGNWQRWMREIPMLSLILCEI
ncbi:MAG: AAA-like domain-containing protein, partial [Chroococcidiopsidaceae cyanobacterium CP_BM_ER_R8_30]|nr:AAA-like domain-containing protein [Chroococcidiopsidaceae cyanobacterium CP_BM_ER_R8_30]